MRTRGNVAVDPVLNPEHSGGARRTRTSIDVTGLSHRQDGPAGVALHSTAASDGNAIGGRSRSSAASPVAAAFQVKMVPVGLVVIRAEHAVEYAARARVHFA